MFNSPLFRTQPEEAPTFDHDDNPIRLLLGSVTFQAILTLHQMAARVFFWDETIHNQRICGGRRMRTYYFCAVGLFKSIFWAIRATHGGTQASKTCATLGGAAPKYWWWPNSGGVFTHHASARKLLHDTPACRCRPNDCVSVSVLLLYRNCLSGRARLR